MLYNPPSPIASRPAIGLNSSFGCLTSFYNFFSFLWEYFQASLLTRNFLSSSKQWHLLNEHSTVTATFDIKEVLLTRWPFRRQLFVYVLIRPDSEAFWANFHPWVRIDSTCWGSCNSNKVQCQFLRVLGGWPILHQLFVYCLVSPYAKGARAFQSEISDPEWWHLVSEHSTVTSYFAFKEVIITSWPLQHQLFVYVLIHHDSRTV